MKNKVISIAFLSIWLFGSFSASHTIKHKVKTIVVDAGHGGKNFGTTGVISKEKNIALAIALKLGKVIEENLKDVKVIYTRTDDTFIELHERANIANKNNADLFISIHCNSSGKNRSKKPRGTETWVMGTNKMQSNLEVSKRENSVILLEENYEEKYEGFDPNAPESNILFSLYQNAYLVNSLNLAEKIEGQFKNELQKVSRGVKQGPFLVLHKSYMPSVLVEVGFLTNPEEEKELNDDRRQSHIAMAIYRAVKAYKDELEKDN